MERRLSLKKPRRNFRPPNRQRFIPCRTVSNRRLAVYQVAICVMLNHVIIWVPPVVKNLRAQNVPTNAPYRPITLLDQVLMAQLLCIKIVDLKGAMVHMRSCSCAHKKTVVVNQFFAAINVGKKGHNPPWRVIVNIEKVTRHKIKVSNIKVKLLLEVLDAKSVVPKLRKKKDQLAVAVLRYIKFSV